VTFTTLVSELNRARSELRSAVTGLTATSAGTRPAGKRWSVAEALEHICRVESSVASLLERLAEKARLKGRLSSPAPQRLPIDMSRLDIIATYDAKPAFPGTEPTRNVELPDALKLLDDSRLRLLAAAEVGRANDCTRLVAPHPAGGRLNFYEWIYSVCVHDRLHLVQVREIVESV
jgi:hypothetical protein